MLWGYDGGIVEGTITHIGPRARKDLPHESFAAAIGGPLAVVPKEEVESDSLESDSSEEMVLIEPRVRVEIGLEESARETLLAGQTGKVMIRGRSQRMGPYLADRLVQFVRKNNLRTHGL